MPDRPRNGGPEDGPDYQWLYGKGGRPEDPQATRPVPKQQRPAPPRHDETRVMRTQPRPGEPARATSRPTPPPVAPPVEPPVERGRGGRGFRRPRFRLRYVFLLLLLWLVYLVVVPVVAWNKVDKADWEPGGERPGDQPGTTYLLVGSDSREGLSKEDRKELHTGNAGGGRTDTIMLLHTGSGPNLLMSIPRDLEVDGSKINGAYARGGASELTETVEGLTGIRIDQYVEIGMGGVVGVVDAVGGVEICPKKRFVDKDAGLDITKGCQEVDGKTALAYSRSRHAQTLGDLDRVRNQREVVAAIGAKVLSPWTVVNPVRWWRLNNAMPDFFVFGEGMGPQRAGLWASAMASVGGKDGLTCTVPVANGSATDLDEERADQLFSAIREDETDKVTDQLCLSSGLIGAE